MALTDGQKMIALNKERVSLNSLTDKLRLRITEEKFPYDEKFGGKVLVLKMIVRDMEEFIKTLDVEIDAMVENYREQKDL